MSLKLFAAVTLTRPDAKCVDPADVPEEVRPWIQRCPKDIFLVSCITTKKNEDSNHELCLYDIKKEDKKAFVETAVCLGRLDYLIENFEDECRFNLKLPSYAVYFGHLDCLRYLIENWCLMTPSIADEAASYGHVDCFRYLHEKGIRGYTDTAVSAATSNRECLEYAHKSGYRMDNPAIAQAAATYGKLECLKYAVENGCPVDARAFEYAAREGHLECIRYLFETGAPRSGLETIFAAKGGHMDCIRYFHEHGFPWDSRAAYQAASRGHMGCLKYLFDNGCPFTVSDILIFSRVTEEMRDYLLTSKLKKNRFRRFFGL